MTARAIMVQGTMSNVGKSLLVAGLCRVLAQDGLRALPFKAQNMALNSYVAEGGFELGRAQAMQAEAAGVEPEPVMNPVLLKPASDVGSQVMVMGRPVGTMPAREYFAYRKRLRGVVCDAYASLAARADVVVIEGAGSPAEINLGRDEFVNMGMARIARAPVLLVGDIDPGGVFAQLAGTMELLSPEDRAMVRGLVVNKFRGDPSLLAPALGPFGERLGAPVLGVVPYLHLDLDDEDSLAPRLYSEAGAAPRRGGAPLDIAAIRLPRLSNFTDLGELERHPLMDVRYVSRAEELGRPDLVVLPGTKNTMADLAWLEDSGIAACLQALARTGTPVIGICGGYQMLGEALDDPLGCEGGAPSSRRGLGLLPVETVFGEAKELGRCTATVRAAQGFWNSLDGRKVAGYEIHMGETRVRERLGARPAVTRDADGAVIGYTAGSVLGTYLHGFFDAPGVADALAAALLRARGLPDLGARTEPREAYRTRQYDALADGVRGALDMDLLRRIIETGLD